MVFFTSCKILLSLSHEPVKNVNFLYYLFTNFLRNLQKVQLIVDAPHHPQSVGSRDQLLAARGFAYSIFNSGLKLRFQPGKSNQLSTLLSRGSWEQQAAGWLRGSTSPQLPCSSQNQLWVANPPARYQQ